MLKLVALAEPNRESERLEKQCIALACTEKYVRTKIWISLLAAAAGSSSGDFAPKSHTHILFLIVCKKVVQR